MCASPEHKAFGRFALEAAGRAYHYFSQYFGVRYPFEKLDLVALPDFPEDAMENAGAIFFNERGLLVDPATASDHDRSEVAAAVSHEIAHQWVGNLVTMRWWDDLWLNEGLATWLESKPVVAWNPAWRRDLADLSLFDAAMEIDTLRSAHAVHAKASTRAEIEETFDDTTYNKGAGILRMIEGYLGEETLRAGLVAYLRAHLFGNASGEELWTALARSSGKPVDRVMQPFIEEPGVPVLGVESRCEGQGQTLVSITQSRFGPTATGPAAEAWPVPTTLRALDSLAPLSPTLLDRLSQTVTLGRCSSAVLVDAGAAGYFYTAYAPGTATRWVSGFGDRLSPVERLRLLDDEWALVRGDVRGIGDYLDLARAFAGDPSPEVIDAVARHLTFVHDYLVTPTSRALFEAWVRETFGPGSDRLGWKAVRGEREERGKLRAALLDLLGSVGRDARVLGWARALLAGQLAGGSVDPSLATTVLRLAVVMPDRALGDQLLAATLAAGPDERLDTLLVVAGAAGPELVGRLLAQALSDPPLRDALSVVRAALANPAANGAALAFIKAHWTEVEGRTTNVPETLRLVGAAASFCDATGRADVQTFFGTKTPDYARTLRLALDQIDRCRDSRLRQAEELARYLRLPRPSRPRLTAD